MLDMSYNPVLISDPVARRQIETQIDWVKYNVSTGAAEALTLACIHPTDDTDPPSLLSRIFSTSMTLSFELHCKLVESLTNVQRSDRLCAKLAKDVQDRDHIIQNRDRGLADLHLFVQQKDRQIQRLQNQSQNVNSIPGCSNQCQDPAKIRHAARKACEARIKSLTPGSSVSNYTREAKRILTTEGAILSQEEQIDSLRNKLEVDRDVSL